MPLRHPSAAALIACWLLAGCAAHGDALAAIPARAAHAGKPAAPVTLHSSVAHSIPVGTPSPVQVELSATIDADSLGIVWVPSAGLVLGKADVPVTITKVEKNKVYKNTVSVSAAGDGEYFLGVIATLHSAGSAQTRAFSIRVNIGSAVAKAKPALQRDAQGNPIESMPAQETVSK